MKKKRPAFRMTPKGDVHDPEAVCWTVDRYGQITPKTREKFCALMDRYNYEYDLIFEKDKDGNLHHITIRVKSGAFYKYLDNERDALQTIENFKDNPPLNRIKLLKSP